MAAKKRPNPFAKKGEGKMETMMDKRMGVPERKTEGAERRAAKRKKK